MFADGAAYEIGGGIRGPGDDQGEEKKFGTEAKRERVKFSGERKREGDK